MPKKSKRPKSQVSNLFSVSLVGSAVLATLLNIVLCHIGIIIFPLNENQLLYLFSFMAQVIGSVFGLTLTAYVFFVDKFKESVNGDDTLYDASTSILSRCFKILILLAMCTGCIVLLCVLGIINLHKWILINTFVANESVLLFSIGLISILTFGVILLDPKKLDKEIAKMKKAADEYYGATSNSTSGDFVDFLRTYNLLEKIIFKLAEELMKSKNASYTNTSHRPQILQSLRILILNEVITDTLSQEINEFRMYRNSLVHGIDFNVNQAACTRIEKVYESLKDVLDALIHDGKNSEKYNAAVEKLNKLS